MKSMQVKRNKHFVGLAIEREKLNKIAGLGAANIVIVHGRRRVGKAELIEQTYGDRNILKFEGLEQQSQATQRKAVLARISHPTSKFAPI